MKSNLSLSLPPSLSLSFSLSLSYTHTHTRTRAHTHIQWSHTHVYTHTRTRVCACFLCIDVYRKLRQAECWCPSSNTTCCNIECVCAYILNSVCVCVCVCVHHVCLYLFDADCPKCWLCSWASTHSHRYALTPTVVRALVHECQASLFGNKGEGDREEERQKERDSSYSVARTQVADNSEGLGS